MSSRERIISADSNDDDDFIILESNGRKVCRDSGCNKNIDNGDASSSEASRFAEKIRVLFDDQDDLCKFTNIVRSFKTKEMLESDAIVKLANMIRHKFDDVILGLNTHLSDGYEIVRTCRDGAIRSGSIDRCEIDESGYQLYYRTPIQEDLIPLLASDVRVHNLVAQLEETKKLLRMRSQRRASYEDRSEAGGRDDESSFEKEEESKSQMKDNQISSRPSKSRQFELSTTSRAQREQRRASNTEAKLHNVANVLGMSTGDGHKINNESFGNKIIMRHSNSAAEEEAIDCDYKIGKNRNKNNHEIKANSRNITMEEEAGDEAVSFTLADITVDEDGEDGAHMVRVAVAHAEAEPNEGGENMYVNDDSAGRNSSNFPSHSLRAFNKKFQQLQEYKNDHGHLNVRYDDDPYLYNFCLRLRNAIDADDLAEDQIHKLKEIGFEFGKDKKPSSRSRDIFDRRVVQLRAYKQQHGHLNVKDRQDRGLSRYCCRLRKAMDSDSLSRDQIEILQDIGFEFTKDASRKPAFNKRVNQLRAYKQQHGHLNVKDSQDRGLINYCYRLRKAMDSDSLSKDQIKTLQDIGFEFTKDTSRVKARRSMETFHQMVGELKGHKNKYGHLNVKYRDYPALQVFCTRLRQSMADNTLGEDKIQVLRGIGFEFTKVSHSTDVTKCPIERFHQRVEDLQAYKKKYGHINIRSKHNRNLYEYCKKLRKAMENNNLPKEKVQILQGIGFEFKEEASQVESRTRRSMESFYRGFEQLQAFKQVHGHCNVSGTYSTLYGYCSRVRKLMADNALTTGQIQVLRDIGFDFESKTDSLSPSMPTEHKPCDYDELVFHNRIKELQAFKAEHGHIYVKEVDNQGLAYWCWRMRDSLEDYSRGEIAKKPLTKDRIRQLEKIGFEVKHVEILNENKNNACGKRDRQDEKRRPKRIKRVGESLVTDLVVFTKTVSDIV